MKKILFMTVIIIMINGILPMQLSILEHGFADDFSTTIGMYRNDINPGRNLVANEIIHITNRSPFLLPSSVIPSNDLKVVKLAKEITKGKISDSEKSKAIFQWVATNISYDYAKSEPFYPNQIVYQDVFKTIGLRKGICMDYARVNATLQRAVGIETKVVYGNNHAWNEVRLNGEWQTEDPTYASGYIDNHFTFVHDYQEKYFYKTEETKIGEFDF